MKPLFTLALLAMPALAAFPNGYTYCKVVTTQHTMVSGAGDLTNYPLTVILTDTDLKTTANGGLVTNSSGFDIGFYPDCSGSGTALKWEMESYSPATGAIAAHVLRPALSHTTDDTIGMYYGGSFSAFQSTASAVWVNYASVWHLGEVTNAQALDSTGNGKDSTTNSATQIVGKVGYGQSFDKASGDSLIFPSLFAGAQADYTISGWISASASDYGVLLDHRGGSSAGALVYTVQTTGVASSFFGPPSDEADSTAVAADSTWHYVVGTRSGTTMSIYVDGNAAVTKSFMVSTVWGSDCRIAETFSGEFYTASSDETRVSNIARSADWILTEYRNQSAPGTYIAEGPRLPQQGGGVRHVVTGDN